MARRHWESHMTADKMQPKGNDRPEQAKPEQVDQQTQQNQTSAIDEPGRGDALGRRPLFRN
jgi:hypothetical protein